MKEIINTPDAPDPVGPYNQAILVNDTLYLSGQVAIDPATGLLVMAHRKAETEQVMKNLAAVLKAAGMDFSNVVKTSIFLKDMGDFNVVNEVYGSCFTSEYPARETVQVSVLPKEVNVEISMIAVR